VTLGNNADPPVRVIDGLAHMAQSGFHGQKFRKLLHLQNTPSSLITRSMRGVEVAATETRDEILFRDFAAKGVKIGRRYGITFASRLTVSLLNGAKKAVSDQ
jgi:hypothetical protein